MPSGPLLPYSQYVHSMKYSAFQGETHEEGMTRIAKATADSPQHERRMMDILMDQRFVFAGRNQAALGTNRAVTALNCYVSGPIDDSMEGIMLRATEAARTLRLGGGIGYDFSPLRPKGASIASLGSSSSGPVSFMQIYNAVCSTIAAAGHRRGAQMAVLRVDHPDIEEYIHAKRDETSLTSFNISVGVTNEFMECLLTGRPFALRFEGRMVREVDPVQLWDTIMRNTWDWAEPGVLFIDTMNQWNNLWYCETIKATNPCSEQPLPPYGACLLGSFNLTKYLTADGSKLDLHQLEDDVGPVVAAMDNVINVAKFPLPEQAQEAATKRRMGIGVMGLANALEVMGHPYGSPTFLAQEDRILSVLKNTAYAVSAVRAQSHGAFKAYDRERYSMSKFVQTLDGSVRAMIKRHGIRNSHLTSIAPTGTIALTADCISGGIEPVFEHEYTRKMHTPEGQQTFNIQDWAYRVHGVRGRTSEQVTIQEHLDVLLKAQKHVDSAVSKTCNVPGTVSYEDFKRVYSEAWERGAKGCTTFRKDGLRGGVLEAKPAAAETAMACTYDPTTGARTCE